MTADPAGRPDPARLPTGRVRAYPAATRSRLHRVEQILDALKTAVKPSAHARPPAEPRRSHDIIPEHTAAGYRCAVCLLAVAPADYATGPAWRHAPDWDRA